MSSFSSDSNSDSSIYSSSSSFSSSNHELSNIDILLPSSPQHVNNFQSFIKSKQNEFSLESYPNETDDIFGMDTNWSHVEKICSNIYLVSSVSEFTSISNEILSRVDTGI